MQVQLTQEAKIASVFLYIRAIFAFVGFVSALKAPRGAFSLDHSGNLQTSTHSPPVLFCSSSQVSFTALLALPAAG